jgi:xanthine phosphoribosyltransferase
MEALKERILRDGIIADHNVLKVDSFLNHQIDVQLIDNIAAEFKARFGDKPITKVLTIETSGVAIAYAVARAFGVNAVFAKKAKSINLDGPVYEAEIPSYTRQNVNRVIVSQKFLSADDHVLIVDDFLANGYAMQGLISIVESADATVEGLGIVIEKGFQEGGERLRNLGYDLQSLAIIESMDHKNGKIEFSK